MSKYHQNIHLNTFARLSFKQLYLLVAMVVLIVFTLGQLLLPLRASAEAVSVYVTSSATTVQQGATFQVSIWADTPGLILDVKARVNYSPSKVSFKQAKYESSPLNERGPEYAVGSGYYTAHQLKQGEPYPSGRTLVGVLEFTALSSSGTGSFTVSSNEDNTSVGNGSDGTTHSPLSVMGVSINFAPAPAEDEPVNSGTNVAAGSNDGGSAPPKTSTATPDKKTSTDNGNAIETEEAIASAEDEIIKDIEATNQAAQAETSEVLSFDDDTKKQMNFPLLVGLVLVVLVAGTILFLRTRNGKNVFVTDQSSNNANTLGEVSDDGFSESLGKFSTEVPEAGASISPDKDA